jgi:hypothetical protein
LSAGAQNTVSASEINAIKVGPVFPMERQKADKFLIRKKLVVVFTKRTSQQLVCQKKAFKTSEIFLLLFFSLTKSLCSRVARFLLVHDTKTGKNVPNEHKMYLMVTKDPKYP